MKIRACEKKDIASICDIYNYYIEHTIITFEEVPLSCEDMTHRIESYMQKFPWLVGEVDDKVIGYAYGAKWQVWSAYKNSVEVTIYLRHGEAGNGHGQRLYKALIQALSGHCHTLIAGIALPNEGSIKLHEKFGFKKVAHFKEVGQKFGHWIDVGYWQKIMNHVNNPDGMTC
jgi:phosphinothricin acetyltransferase